MRGAAKRIQKEVSLIDVKCIKMQNFPVRDALFVETSKRDFSKKRKKEKKRREEDKKNLSSFDQIYSRLMQAAFLTYLQDDFHWDRMREIFMLSPPPGEE